MPTISRIESSLRWIQFRSNLHYMICFRQADCAGPWMFVKWFLMIIHRPTKRKEVKFWTFNFRFQNRQTKNASQLLHEVQKVFGQKKRGPIVRTIRIKGSSVDVFGIVSLRELNVHQHQQKDLRKIVTKVLTDHMKLKHSQAELSEEIKVSPSRSTVEIYLRIACF